VKRQKPATGSQCGHMPLADVSLETVFKAAYEQDRTSEEEQLHKILLKVAAKIGVEQTEDIPEFCLRSLQLCWTDPDLSTASSNARYGPAILTIQAAKAIASSMSHCNVIFRYCTEPKYECSNTNGPYYLMAIKTGSVNKGKVSIHLDNRLYRFLLKADGSIEVGSNIHATNELLKWFMDYIHRDDNPINFFSLPVHFISCYDLEKLIRTSLELHPHWYPRLLGEITCKYGTGSDSSYKRYCDHLQKDLNDKLHAAATVLSEVQQQLGSHPYRDKTVAEAPGTNKKGK